MKTNRIAAALVAALFVAPLASHAQRLGGGFGSPPPPTPYHTTISDYAGLAGTPGYYDGVKYWARMSGPTHVATDGAGNTWVFDAGNNAIRLVSGNTVSTWKNSLPNNAWSIGGMAVDPYTYDLYFTDMQYHVITRLDHATGNYVTHAGMAVSSGFGSYLSGFVDGTGSAARFNTPVGIAIDINRKLYVADSGNHAIRVITPGGAVSTLVQDASFNPMAIALSEGIGRLYAVSNNAIYAVTLGSVSLLTGGSTPAGQLSWVAGATGGMVTTHVDGDASVARFVNPASIAADSSGNVFVADSEAFFDPITLTFRRNGFVREVLLGTYRYPSAWYIPTTVTTLSLSAAFVPYGYAPGQGWYSDTVMQKPAGIAFWGTALVMSDSERQTVRVIR